MDGARQRRTVPTKEGMTNVDIVIGASQIDVPCKSVRY